MNMIPFINSFLFFFLFNELMIYLSSLYKSNDKLSFYKKNNEIELV